MMKVEHLNAAPDRAGRYLVKFEDGTVMRLYRQTLEDFCLYAGAELDEAQMSRLRKEAGAMSAKMRAVRIISASNVSKRDLEQRLIQKGEDPAQAQDAVSWLAEMNVLDDEKTAEQIVSSCIRKGYGIARAKQALYEKRIPKEIWSSVLQDYPDQREYILAYLRDKVDDPSDRKEIRRVIDSLIRRGHSYPQIRSCLQQLSLDEDEFPEG